jgi:hypothetical protein
MSPVGEPNPPCGIWLPHDELPPSFRKHTTASQKLMITILWNPHGFRVTQSLPKGIKWTVRHYSNNIFSQIGALRDVGSHWRWSSIPITPVRLLQNVSRNIWTINHWKEHLIPPTHLISHHLIFIDLDMSSINYRDMNSRKERSLFRRSQKIWLKFRPIHWLIFLKTGWKGVAMYWY